MTLSSLLGLLVAVCTAARARVLTVYRVAPPQKSLERLASRIRDSSEASARVRTNLAALTLAGPIHREEGVPGVGLYSHLVRIYRANGVGSQDGPTAGHGGERHGR